MRRRFPSLVLSLLLLGSAVRADAPLNLSAAKVAVIAYHDEGAYEHDLQQVADVAIAWLHRRATQRADGERLAVVFDVDETVLSNYPNMVQRDFGYDPEQWVEWVAAAAAPALRPVREVYRTARALDIDVIFLTGRKAPAEAAGTIENLRRAGMADYARLILRSDEDTAPTAARRKAARRAQLESEGWTIIASIGDQHSDLTGGHAERTFKLPNPFYHIP